MLNSSRVKLLNQNNFGTSGTYPKSINIIDGYSTSGSLCQIITIPKEQIFFFGAFNILDGTLQQFTSAEIDSLYNWSKLGGKLIIGATAGITGYNPSILNSKWEFDLAIIPAGGTFNPTANGNTTDIFNGPFGTISSSTQGGGAQGYFTVMLPNSVVLATNTNGTPSLIMDCNTLDLIAADVDGFTSVGGVSSGNSVSNTQDMFWVNTIVFMDKLQPPPIISNTLNTLSLNSTYISYQWYLNNDPISGATKQIYIPDETGNYSVEVTVNGGCRVLSDVLRTDSLPEENVLTMPNVFTPNNDNLNDIFIPIKIKGITVNQVSIFNRWGDLIHKENSPKIFWDGKSNGENVSDGIYYWIVEYQNSKGIADVMHGFLQLIR